MKVAVIGAGVNGISCAYLIKETYPKLDVTVFADRFTPDTTSDVAAGICRPGNVGKTPRKKLIQWGKETISYALDLLKHDANAHLKGVSMIHGSYISIKDEVDDGPDWKDVVMDFKVLGEKELNQFPSHIKSGYSCTTVIIECCKYIPALTKEFTERGGRIINQRIKTLDTLFNFDLIINCSALGAKELFNDNLVTPVRGHVLRVKAPWVKGFTMALQADETGRWCYIIPNQDSVILGGTVGPGDSDLDVRDDDRRWILKNTQQVLPSLKHAEILSECVGLRPSREEIRLEKEQVCVTTDSHQTKQINVIHNYGHGGHGVALSWGCARNVLELMQESMTFPAKI